MIYLHLQIGHDAPCGYISITSKSNLIINTFPRGQNPFTFCNFSTQSQCSYLTDLLSVNSPGHMQILFMIHHSS